MHMCLKLTESLQEYLYVNGYRFTSKSVKYFYRFSDWMYQTYERYYSCKFHFWELIKVYEILVANMTPPLHEFEIFMRKIK